MQNITTKLIDGKAYAKALNACNKEICDTFKAQHGLNIGLHVILVGEHGSSQIYVRNKQRVAEKMGIACTVHKYPENVPQKVLAEEIKHLNDDKTAHGIIVQLPLPSHLNADEIQNYVSPEKDVDGLTTLNAGRRIKQDARAIIPCTPKGILMLLADNCPDLTGKTAAIIGRSHIVGLPMRDVLMAQNVTTIMIHRHTVNPAELCKQADIVIVAAGHPKLVTKDWVKSGAIVIDVGITRTDKGPVGDCDFDGLQRVASAITPVPGGVGPMTVACLMDNTIQAARKTLA